MYMDVKVFIFTLWAFSFTLAQNQNVEKCFRRSIAFDKTQTSDLLDSYTHDQIVKVNCELGYVGFVKLRCKNGQWEKIGGRDCKKKPCGHPGDTQNGDFELTEETEFVFGATVKYTCRPGYVMASRVSTRRCLSQGWDNAIPVCEVVKCPAISSFADVIARGNTEDANFGDVIHFECASDKKMLDNPEDIHCTEEGSWSGPVPKCIEIKCRPPEIQNGDITNYKKEYKENDHLTYRCQPHYNPRPGIPKCTKYGWSMKPDCEEILCLLDPPTLGRKETNPIGKNVFRVGDQVEIICSEGYWFKNSKQQSKTFRCKDNGKWNGTTTCEEIICERPRGQFVQSTQLFYFKKEGDTVSSYQCEYGYRAAGPTASCTRDGWKPNPLCIEIKCQLPTIQHGYVTNPKSEYKINERLTYACNTGYEPEKTRNIQCNKHDNWENVPRCKVKEGACEELSLENGFMHSLNGQHQSYSYACEPGYKLFHENWWGVVNCIDGKWTFVDFPSKKPLCIDINECGFLPSDPHVALPHTQQVYKDGYASKQVCSPGYAPKQSHIKCENGKWNIPDCIRTCGPPPYIENAVITSHTQRTATYGCRDLFEIKGNPTISCSNSKWGKEPTCELSSIACLQPKHDIFNGLLEESDNVKKYLYKKDDIVKYKCSDNFVFEEKDIATCIGKEWEYPTCMKACGGPPYTENAVITSLTQLRATYTCRDLFEMNGNAIISCKNSNWGEKPTCELSPSACSQPQKTIKQGQIKDSPRLKEYFEKNSTVTYVCDDKLLPTARCIGKAWEYPNCTGQD